VDSGRDTRPIVRTEVAKVVCVDCGCHTRHSIRTDLQHGDNNTFSFLHSDGSNKLTLRV